jgi:calpain-15
VGSCYFLAALSALAETPDNIKRIFDPESRVWNRQGIYCVIFYVNGKRTPVLVDSLIPTLHNEQQDKYEPFSTTTFEDEIWAILVEKAWAKLHGSYQRIEGGLPSNALFALTGKPSWRHLHSTSKNIFPLLKSYE